MPAAAHAPVRLKGRLTWLVCRHCGLVWLRNPRTQAAIRRPCPGAP